MGTVISMARFKASHVLATAASATGVNSGLTMISSDSAHHRITDVIDSIDAELEMADRIGVDTQKFRHTLASFRGRISVFNAFCPPSSFSYPGNFTASKTFLSRNQIDHIDNLATDLDELHAAVVNSAGGYHVHDLGQRICMREE